MAVYVDDMRRPAQVGRVRGRWSHLMADTSEELHAFADRLGLQRSWVQHAGTHREHYDVTDAVRARALTLGAESVSYPRGTGDLLNRKREAVKLPAEVIACGPEPLDPGDVQVVREFAEFLLREMDEAVDRELARHRHPSGRRRSTAAD